MKNTNNFKPYFSRFFHILCVVFLLSFTSHIFGQEKPGPDNTGPSGTLEAQSGATITVDGTVIENKHITGCIHIKASNVTIRNCIIDGVFDWYAVRCDYGTDYTNFLIEDCELIQGQSALIKGSNFTMRRCNLHESGGDAIKPITNCLVEYCWIHHLGMADGAHADGVQSFNGGADMTFRYNNFDMPFYIEDPYKSNNAFLIQNTYGTVSMLIEYNWLNGGSFTMNPGPNDVLIRYNKFGRDYAYGIFYPGIYDLNSCNVWEDTGEPVDNCDENISVTGVTISPASQIIPVGQTTNLTATVEPNDATNQTMVWSSSNTSVATVDDNGVVSALSEGLATITVTTDDGGFTATSDITITSGASGGLNPVEDAYVRGGTYADDNFGTASALTIKNEPGNLSYTRESFLKFDLSSLGGVPESAVLRLYLESSNGYSSHSVFVVNDDSWTETGITYNNQPTAGAEITNFQTPDVESWVEVDILSAVQSEAGGLLSLKIVSDNNSVNSYDSREGTNAPELIIETATAPAQEAYNGPHTLPGLLQAEDYDIGGQDIAFNDDASKSGLATFRPDDFVDVEATSDDGGGYNIGWIRNGEWLEYTLSSIENGTYDIKLRVASANTSPGDITIKLGDGPDGTNFTTLGTISVPTTGNWQAFETISLNDIELADASDKVLRLEFLGNSFNLNWIEFVKQQPLQEAYNGPHSIPGVIQAEDYDLGGQDIAYNDDDSKNGLATYRPDDNVDVAATSDVGGGYNIGWIKNGEWLEYTLSSIENGIYNINIRVASANTYPGDITVKLGDGPEGTNFTTLGTISAPATGDWQVFETISLNDIELADASDKVLRLEFSGNAFNLNWIEFAQQAPPVVTTTLYPISDTYVRNGYYEDRNYGEESVLYVKKGYSSQSFESFMMFDLALFDEASIESATLRLFVNANEGDATHFVYQIDDDTWAETGLTWLNKPASGAEIAQYSATSSGGYIDIDVFPAVQSEKGELLSLQVLTSELLFFLTTYDSREGANPPQLVIEASNGAIPVSGITVTPSNIALNQGASVTLAAEVSPGNASNNDITWSSNNTGIAIVDANGVVSAITEGSAVITATSVDGGYTDECTVTVNAASTSQLMNLDAPTSARFTLPQEVVWPSNVGEANVCLWHNDKYAAASISIDDNIENQHTWWIDKGIEYPGLVFTWMAMPVSINSWSSFQSLIDAGHAVDAHDKCEINDFTDTDYRNRVIDNQNQINQNLTNNQCLAYAYPCGVSKAELIRDLFIVMRGVLGKMNSANEINYLGVASRSAANDLHDIRVLLDENELLFGKSYNRGWLSYHYHQLNDDYPQTTDTFLAALHAKLDSIWVGTYTNIAKYGQERDSHTLSVTEIGTDNIKFNLTDLMNDLIFDFPLTVKVRVPNDWNGLYATQNGSAIEVSLVENTGNKYALVKAVPDRGQVIVGDSGAKSQSKFSQISQMSDALSVKVYPNPLSKNNVLSVSLNGGIDDAIEGLRIIDMAGRLVFEQNNISAKTVMISEAGLLKKGVYILMIKSNSTLQKQKLIVE